MSMSSKHLLYRRYGVDIDPCGISIVLNPNHGTRGEEWNVSSRFLEEDRHTV